LTSGSYLRDISNLEQRQVNWHQRHSMTP